jgi:aminoglycoside 3-N-acetyltransferase I
MQIRRLGVDDADVAQQTFVTMADVFGAEGGTGVSLEYTRRLLRDVHFWVLSAVDGGEVVGGLTAHELAMTRSETTELFIYDVAVREDRQRTGVGRALITHLLNIGERAGIKVYFVPADNEDTHALDFYRNVGGTPSAVTFFTFET